MSRPVAMSIMKLILVCGSALLLASCGDSRLHDLEEFVAEVEAREPGRIKPLPEVQPIETFAYISIDRRDPFRVMQSEQEQGSVVDSGLAPDETRRKEELEAFPLDSIRMVGTLEQQGTVWGLVRTQEGVIFRVKVGNYMGQNHGQITRISEEGIELTEIIADQKRGYRERQASLALTDE